MYNADMRHLLPIDLDKKQILMRNARQILEVVTATFGFEDFESTTEKSKQCDQPQSDVEELACAWREIVATDGSSSETLDPAWTDKITKVCTSLL